MGETWRGIYPITAFVRDALRKKAASGLLGGLSAPEETLLTVCEFWFAVNTGALAERLKSDAIVHLLRTQGAFGRLGAVRIASTLRAAIAQLTREQQPASVLATAAHIEEALSRTEDPVDDLIAQFAMNQPDLVPTSQIPHRQAH